MYVTARKVVNKGYYDKIYVSRIATAYMAYSQSDNKFKFLWSVGVDSTNKCRVEVQICERINGEYTAWTTDGVLNEIWDRSSGKIECYTGFMSFGMHDNKSFYFVTKDSNVKELVANRSK